MSLYTGPTSLMFTVLDALEFAAQKHRGQYRKGADKSPYINHLISVTRLLAGAGQVMDTQTLQAGVLHDILEDTNTTVEELTGRFGADVAGVVQEVTDDKSLPKLERKRLQEAHAASMSHSAKLVKAADKIANLVDLTNFPPLDWEQERLREYVAWSERVVAACGELPAGLQYEYSVVINRARKAVNIPTTDSPNPMTGA